LFTDNFINEINETDGRNINRQTKDVAGADVLIDSGVGSKSKFS
jgi:hypothetical protein